MRDFLVRNATIDDVAELARLRWNFRGEDGDEVPVVSKAEFEVHYARYFSDGEQSGMRKHWIAVGHDGPIGTIAVQKVDMVPKPKKIIDQWGYVTDNYVVPHHRNRGIGRALLNTAIAWAKTQDLETLIVWPSDRAVPHYLRAGFVKETEIHEMVLRAP